MGPYPVPGPSREERDLRQTQRSGEGRCVTSCEGRVRNWHKFNITRNGKRQRNVKEYSPLEPREGAWPHGTAVQGHRRVDSLSALDMLNLGGGPSSVQVTRSLLTMRPSSLKELRILQVQESGARWRSEPQLSGRGQRRMGREESLQAEGELGHPKGRTGCPGTPVYCPLGLH